MASRKIRKHISKSAKALFDKIPVKKENKNIVDIIEGLSQPKIDVNADLKDLYYLEKKN